MTTSEAAICARCRSDRGPFPTTATVLMCGAMLRSACTLANTITSMTALYAATWTQHRHRLLLQHALHAYGKSGTLTLHSGRLAAASHKVLAQWTAELCEPCTPFLGRPVLISRTEAVVARQTPRMRYFWPGPMRSRCPAGFHCLQASPPQFCALLYLVLSLTFPFHALGRAHDCSGQR